jgi:hypothetical protein
MLMLYCWLSLFVVDLIFVLLWFCFVLFRFVSCCEFHGGASKCAFTVYVIEIRFMKTKAVRYQ